MAQRWQSITAVLLAALVAPACSTDYPFLYDARGGVVRDKLYFEGGLLGNVTSQGIFSLGTAGQAQFNFSSKFDNTTNWASYFSQNINYLNNAAAKVHINGFMIADNDEWYSFGGRAFQSYDTHSTLTEINRDALYIPNPDAVAAPLGFTPNYSPKKGNATNSDWYVTNGAGVSVPSESLGFYFSGLKSANGTELSYNARVNTTGFPSVLADSMLRVNTASFGDSDWAVYPLPDFVPPRADAVVAWVPTGAKGILVVIGGLPFPGSVYQNLASCTVTTYSQNSNNSIAASLMTSLSIYDIASGTWYSQNATGDTPPQLAQACAVVAYPQDRSTFNIYVYGGSNGVDATAASDAVWVLSLPSFTWVQVNAGDTSHGRSGHICAKPYEDQMMVVGGVTKCNGALQTSNFADIFNLTTLQWEGAYDPAKYSSYAVPSKINDAVKAASAASVSSGLSSLLSTRYTGNLISWGPYNSTNGSTPITPTPTPTPSGHPKWLIPVVVVIAILAALAAGFILWRCCCGKGGDGTASESGRSRRSTVSRWVHGTRGATDKSVTTDDEMTQVNDTPAGYFEADSYFKTRPQTHEAELPAPDSTSTSPLRSPFHSPPGARSPSSPSTATELHSPPTRYELPGNFVPHSEIIKTHPMFPHNIDGMSSAHSHGSVSSPSSDALSTPNELPHKRSNEDILPAPPNDNILGESKVTARKPLRSPLIGATQHDHEPVSPNLSAANVSPDQGPTQVPLTPPVQPIDPGVNKNNHAHTRNASSLSSGYPDLASPSPREDARRSMAIAALPESPSSSAAVSPGAEATSDADPNPSSPQRREAPVERQIRRKEVRNWPSSGRTSAYKENEDLYGGGRETV